MSCLLPRLEGCSLRIKEPELRVAGTAVRELARLGTISAAASVPGTVTVCSSRAAKISSVGRSAIRGVFGRNGVTSRCPR
ncbi:hypothetical protein ACFYYU_47060 [Streptomyces olivochromogenes]|uniref:hypothetical protein n=1 Tax=Streptomyces olivochromogenes TaxID=1963 RepID=UPI00367BCC64